MNHDVLWALGRPCPLRRREGWARADVTHDELAYLRLLSEARDDDRVAGGIAFISWTREDGRRVPWEGFLVREGLAPLGAAAVEAACGACEANLARAGIQGLAGCHGRLSFMGPSRDLDTKIAALIEARGLRDAVERAFPETSVEGYRFWIDSPLTQAQRDILLAIIPPLAVRGAEECRRFTLALEVARAHDLPLHVTLTPLGHHTVGSDSCFEDVFPHCPRCKAMTEQRDGAVCRICGRARPPGEPDGSAYVDRCAVATHPVEALERRLRADERVAVWWWRRRG
jgi:hypothetical protein